MQVAGLVDNYGDSEMPLLVPVHYPWVAAHVAGKWIHLFPWLKDTEIVEGLDLYDFLPVAYGSGNRWLKHYIEGDTNILHLSARGNTPSLLFPRFIERSLHQNFPGLSLEDLGMQVRARRRNFSAWVDFPQPHADLDDLQALKNLSSPGAGLAARLTNIFDTVRVEVYSVRHPGRRIGTGDLRMADLHNRGNEAPDGSDPGRLSPGRHGCWCIHERCLVTASAVPDQFPVGQ
jgi:hypothetical protein